MPMNILTSYYNLLYNEEVHASVQAINERGPSAVSASSSNTPIPLVQTPPLAMAAPYSDATQTSNT